MPVLKNPKHELFAQELAKGKTQVEAYALAGYKPNDGNAAKMAGFGNIIARVQEITGSGAEKAACTVASIIAELDEARLLAMKLAQPAPMVSASMGKAKVSGLLVDRAELTGKDGGPIETKDVSPREMLLDRIAGIAARGGPGGGDGGSDRGAG